MIEKRHELSDENGYKKYSHFTISPALEELLNEEYYLYKSKEFTKASQLEAMYKKNFNDKYDEVANAAVFEKFINNEAFKNKALFIYNLINEEKYRKFALEHENLPNPNDYSCEYNIIDSEGVKVNVYNLNIVDISFVY